MSDLPGTPVSNNLSASGDGNVFTPRDGEPVFLTLTGTWVGTITVKRSRDAGSTWQSMTAAGAPWGVFTGNCDEPVDEPANTDFRYKVSFTRTSGTLTAKWSH